jgi:hypothetical protein
MNQLWWNLVLENLHESVNTFLSLSRYDCRWHLPWLPGEEGVLCDDVITKLPHPHKGLDPRHSDIIGTNHKCQGSDSGECARIVSSDPNFLTLSLDGGEWSASCSGCFYPWERTVSHLLVLNKISWLSKKVEWILNKFICLIYKI